MAVLLVCGAAAFSPLILFSSQPRNSPPLRPGLQRPGFWIVESSKGEWFVNGTRQSRSDISRFVRRHGRSWMMHYLPSNALPLEKVSLSLRWLRSLAPGSVVLELPPPSRSLP